MILSQFTFLILACFLLFIAIGVNGYGDGPFMRPAKPLPGIHHSGKSGVREGGESSGSMDSINDERYLPMVTTQLLESSLYSPIDSFEGQHVFEERPRGRECDLRRHAGQTTSTRCYCKYL